MNILICDANESDAKDVKSILDYSYGSKMETVVFHRADDAITYIRSGADVDICFLETVTSEMDGIELARTLRSVGYKGDIAFLTELNCYAHEAFDVRAISYILKPVMPEEIREIVRNAEYRRKRISVNSTVIYKAVDTAPHSEVSRFDRVKQFLYRLLN